MVKVNLIGFKELEAKLKKAPDNIKKEVGAEIQLGGQLLVNMAKRSLASGMLKHPTGQLEGSIAKVPIGQTADLHCEVTVGKLYAPYIEWGTITKVRVPSELASYAAQFKGRGLRKNGGISPRPFFFKHIPAVRKEILQNLENVLTDL